MEYAAFLRFTLAGASYAWGSREEYRAGQQHEGVLTSWPTPQEAWPDQYGLMPMQRFDIEAVNQPDILLDHLGLPLLDERGQPLLDTGLGGIALDTYALAGTEATLELVTTEDGTDMLLDETGAALLDETGDVIRDSQGGRIERSYTKVVSIAAYRLRPGALTLTLTDIDSARLDAIYPSRTFTVDDWPELFEEHVGRPVPWVTGLALKIPLTYIESNGGAGPWVYAACEAPASVLTVYRDGRIVAASEYTVSTLTAGGYTVVTLTFSREQTDPSGRHYGLSADMSSSASYNAADELARVLTLAGLSIDAGSFAAARGQAEAQVMRVHCRYVQPRTYRAIVDDIALVLRGHIHRTAGGAIGIAQDVAGVPVMALDESAGDLIEVSEVRGPERPANIELHYRPSPADPTQTLHTLTRAAGGASGVARYEALYVYANAVADRLACYLAQRAKFAARMHAKLYGRAVALGDILSITAPSYYPGARDWRVAQISHIPAGADLELLQYDPAIYDYVAGAVPADAINGYQPDYSNTPPAAPTALTIVSSGAVVATTGHVSAWVKLKATPPTVNWAQVWFAATNDATGEIYQAQGADNGDGTWGATIPGLRPTDAHHVIAWAVNASGVLGLVTTPVAHTSATDTTVPAVPTGLAAAQGTGTTIRLVWNAVSDADLAYYEIQRNVGGGAYSTFATVPANPSSSQVLWSAVGFSYGTTYGFRVCSVDRAGNASAYCTPVSIAPAANVGSTDITTGGVGSTNIAGSAVTTAKRQAVNRSTNYYSLGLSAGAMAAFQITHNLGRNVTATAFSDTHDVAVWIDEISTNAFYVVSYNLSGVTRYPTVGADYW